MADAFGLSVQDLPAHWMPLRVAAVIECLDEDGQVVLVTRMSADLPVWAALGLHTVAAALCQADVVTTSEADDG